MFKEQLRRLTVLGGVSGALLFLPGDAQAFFGWFKKHCACQQVNYASYYLSTPCATQTCQYVPQTAYRVNYVTVPVTTYRPVVGCGACGQQVVSMRPLIAYTRQAQVVPYQTYRLSCSTTPVVAAYPTQTVGYAATTSYAAPAAVPSCCSGGTSSMAPAGSYAAPAYSGPTIGSTYGADPAATVAPSLSNGVVPGSAPVQGSSSYPPGYVPYTAPYTTYPSSTYPPASTYPQSTVIQQGATQSPSVPQETRRVETNGLQQAPSAPAAPTDTRSSTGDPAGLVPIPDRNTNGGDQSTGVNGVESSHERSAGPMIPDPESRSTERSPRNQWWAYSPVSLQSAAPASKVQPSQPKAANADGWRPSKR